MTIWFPVNAKPGAPSPNSEHALTNVDEWADTEPWGGTSAP